MCARAHVYSHMCACECVRARLRQKERERQTETDRQIKNNKYKDRVTESMNAC